MYLWPWISGAAIFHLFVASPQGTALASRYAEEHFPASVVVGAVSSASLVVVLGCLLSLVGRAARHASRPFAVKTYSINSATQILIDGVWLALLAAAFGSVFGLGTHSTTSVVAWLTVALLTLVIALAIVWAIRSAGNEHSHPRRILFFLRRHRFVLAVLAALVAIVPLGFGATIAIVNPTSFALAGPLLIGMMGLAATSTLFGMLLVTIPLCLGRPWIGVLIIAVMVAFAAFRPPELDQENPLLRDAASRAYQNRHIGAPCKRLPASLPASLYEHVKDADLYSIPGKAGGREGKVVDRTIYLVSAEGGGIRAAYWTALNLAQLDIATDGRFGEETASLSGVSGGSLGIATWLAARDRTDLDAKARLALSAKFLGADFLSPIVGGLLFLDVPRLALGPAWPSIKREHVFEKALSDYWTSIAGTDFFARPMLSLCIRGLQKVPAVYFNATDAETGSHVALTPSESAHD